jgi:hypothetical protein
MTTRAISGGYEPRFHITRTDGQPIPANRRYMVLSFDGSDPDAVAALLFYADRIEASNPTFAADLRRHIANPAEAPAQHGGR